MGQLEQSQRLLSDTIAFSEQLQHSMTGEKTIDDCPDVLASITQQCDHPGCPRILVYYCSLDVTVSLSTASRLSQLSRVEALLRLEMLTVLQKLTLTLVIISHQHNCDVNFPQKFVDLHRSTNGIATPRISHTGCQRQ